MSNDTSTTPQNLLNDGDIAWMLASSALVMLMTPGLAFFYGGLVHKFNVVNTIMMSFMCLGLVSLHWVIFGYSFAFGPGNPGYGSGNWIGMKGVGADPNPDYAPTIPHSLYCVYQMMFACITSAIITGGMVERMKFSTYLIFTVCWTTLVYDTVAHWIWSAWTEADAAGNTITKFGWLRQLGSLDFAGGTAVHISSGVSSLVASCLLPPRENKPNSENVGYVMLGTALLWFGWFGFNAGSALTSGSLASQAFINTQTATATGFFFWTVLDLLVKKKVEPVGAACGAVIGLVAITPAAGFVHTPSSIAFGIIPVVIIYFWLILRARYLQKFFPGADTLDVFAGHGIGGIVGCIMVGFFSSTDINSTGENGVFFSGGGLLLGYQLAAITSVATYSAVATLIIVLVLKYTVGLTYDKENWDKIDYHQHGVLILTSPGKKDSVMEVMELSDMPTKESVTNGEEENTNNNNVEEDFGR